MEKEEKQSQEVPKDKYQSFEDIVTGRPRREAAGRGIERIDPTVRGK